MNLHLICFKLPQSGETCEEYQDAYSYNLKIGRIALADGVSVSYDSGVWAKSLVQVFTDIERPDCRTKEALAEIVNVLSKQWWDSIYSQWDNLPVFSRRQASRVGAATTFLGVVFDPPNEIQYYGVKKGSWQALAVGDTCLFQIRKDELLICFPLKKCKDFGMTPTVLGTNERINQRGLDDLKIYKESYQVGDTFLLTTDALAEWFVCAYRRKERPWRKIQTLTTQEEFTFWISQLRQEKVIRDDDTTLMVIRVLQG